MRRPWLQTLAALWRQFNGDTAYADYCQHLATHHASQAPLSRGEFYQAELVRRWNSIRRCC